MYKFVLLVLSFTFSFLSFSQNFHKTTITKTEDYKNLRLYYEKLFPLENKVLIVRYGPTVNSEVSFQVFSRQPFSLVASKIEKMPGEYLNVETVQKMNDRIYLFYSIFNGKQKASQLFVREINTEIGGFVGEPRQILNITENLVYSSRQRDKFQFSTTPKNELLIEYKFVSKEKDESKKQEKIGVLVIDAELSEIYNGVTSIPQSQVKTGTKAIDAKGNLYVFYERTGTSKPEYGFFKIANGGDLEDIPVDFNGSKINDVKFSLVNEQLICTGFYSKYDTKESTGMFVSYMNGINTDIIFHDFSNDIVQKYNNATKVATMLTDKYKQVIVASNRGLLDMIVTDILPLENGELLIAGNRRDSIWKATDSGGRYLTFEYLDIVLSKLDNKGNLIWMEKLPRKNFDEFKIFIDKENEINLLYSDNSANSALPTNKAAETPDWGGIMTLCKINKNGERTYVPLFKIREVDDYKLYDCTAKFIALTSDKSFLFEAGTSQNKLKLFNVVID